MMMLIPYFKIPDYPLGPFTLGPFGVFVAVGVYIAARVVVAQAEKKGLPSKTLADYAFWGLVGGLVGGHLMHLFFYHPEELQKSPLQIIRFWDGLSSTGGLLGGVVAAFIFFRVRKVAFWDYGDQFALAVPIGWSIARLGCFVVHDHPGVHTDFFLAVNFPEGPRHDLGLYDAIWLAVIALTVYVLQRRNLLEGRRLALTAMMYSVARVFFDTLRATDLSYVDKRYLGFTPAQYFCAALFLYGAYRMVKPVPPSAPLRQTQGSTRAAA